LIRKKLDDFFVDASIRRLENADGGAGSGRRRRIEFEKSGRFPGVPKDWGLFGRTMMKILFRGHPISPRNHPQLSLV
jgi:hypothetical protein